MKIRAVAVAVALTALAAAGCADGTRVTGGNALPVGETPTTTAAPPPAPDSTTGAPGPEASTPAPEASTPAPEASPVSTRCHTSELGASFRAGDAGAGNRYAQLVLTNRANRTCTVYGYGGLQPLDASGQELPFTLARNPTDGGPSLVRLTPGATVARTIHWTVVPAGTAPCPEPVSASIIPPDETDPLVVPWPLGPVCNGKLDGTPFGVTL